VVAVGTVITIVPVVAVIAVVTVVPVVTGLTARLALRLTLPADFFAATHLFAPLLVAPPVSVLGGRRYSRHRQQHEHSEHEHESLCEQTLTIAFHLHPPDFRLPNSQHSAGRRTELTLIINKRRATLDLCKAPLKQPRIKKMPR